MNNIQTKIKSHVKDDLQSIKDLIAVNTLQMKAIDLLEDIFRQVQKNDPIINQQNHQLVMHEELNPSKGYGFGYLVTLEWGRKIRLTQKETKFIENQNKFKKLLSKIALGFVRKNVTKSIVKTDYAYICFHINSYQIVFPHNPSFVPIGLENFITNSKIILPYVAQALNKPIVSNKILKINLDY